MGFGGMLIPLTSVLVVLTLLPALPQPRRTPHRLAAHPQGGPRLPGLVGLGPRTIVRHRWLAVTVAVVALGLAITPVFGLQIGLSGSDSLASSGVAHDTLRSLETGGVGTGVLTPMNLLVKPGADAQAFAGAAMKVDGIRMAVVTPPGKDGIVNIVVVPDHETLNNANIATVTAVRDATKHLPGYDGIAGAGATVIDYQKAVYDNFPYVLALIALVTFVLLGPDVPLNPAAAEGGRAQPAQRRRRLRPHYLVLAGRPRVQRGLRHPRPPGLSRSGCRS